MFQSIPSKYDQVLLYTFQVLCFSQKYVTLSKMGCKCCFMLILAFLPLRFVCVYHIFSLSVCERLLFSSESWYSIIPVVMLEGAEVEWVLTKRISDRHFTTPLKPNYSIEQYISSYCISLSHFLFCSLSFVLTCKLFLVFL